MEQLDLYDRQKSIGLNIPEAICVVGVGGVGAWCALDLALVGGREIILVDDDIIENHNLNRTPYKRSQIGMYKVHAMAELIIERRLDANVIAIPSKIEKLDKAQFNLVKDCEIIDCRDISNPLPEGLKCRITGGYNGTSITIHAYSKPNSVWTGTGMTLNGYRVIPSYLIPPQFIANMITHFLISNYPSNEEGKEIIETFNIDDILNHVLNRTKESIKIKNLERENANLKAKLLGNVNIPILVE